MAPRVPPPYLAWMYPAQPNAIATRRAFVAGLGVVATPGLLRADATFDTQVLVVGAGVAGLAAMRKLREAGVDAVAVEARSRIGGRVLTETALGAPYDAGALYIHWAERNPLTAIAAGAGIRAQSDDAARSTIRSFDAGAQTTPAARVERGANFDRLGAMLDGDAIADVPIAMLAHAANPPLDEAATGLARLALGDEPDRISARDYARLWSGDDLVLPSGQGQLVDVLARDIDVRRATPVRAINWSGAGVTVDTASGTLRARKVIVTVPVGVLKAGGIRFTPELPLPTRDALEGIEMGALTKLGMRFDFAKLDLAQGDIFARDNGVVIDFDCKPFGADIVVAIFGGDFARAITRSPEDTTAAMLDAFVRAVGGDARKAFRASRLHAWHREEYSFGCYSHCRPGHADARAALRAPVGDRIIFAGEASAPDGAAMTTGGAYLAGVAAARWAMRG